MHSQQALKRPTSLPARHLHPAQFKLAPIINFGHVAAIFFLTVVPYTVTTIIPSWRAATIDPDAVMR